MLEIFCYVLLVILLYFVDYRFYEIVTYFMLLTRITVKIGFVREVDLDKIGLIGVVLIIRTKEYIDVYKAVFIRKKRREVRKMSWQRSCVKRRARAMSNM